MADNSTPPSEDDQDGGSQAHHDPTSGGRRKPRRTGLGRIPATLGAAALIAATACGGGAAGKAAGNAGVCTGPGVTSDALKVGLIYPDAGPIASTFSGFRAGVQARFAVENANGGVNGRRLEYDWQDDTANDARNLAAARNLVEGAGVFSILELSNATQGSAQYLHTQGVPVFGPGIEPSWSTFDNMFAWATFVSSSSSITTWGDFVRAHGGTKAAVIETSFDALGRLGVNMISNSMQAAGVQVVAKIDMSTTSTDPRQVLQQIKASGADTVTGQIYVTQLVPLLQATRAAGMSFKVILTPSNFYDSDILRRYGQVLDGVYVYLDSLPFELNRPAHQLYRQAMEQYAPEAQPPEQATALNGWIVADMFIEGARLAGKCPTRTTLITSLRDVHDYTAGGLLPGPTDFAAFRNLSRCYSFVRFTPQAFSVQEPVNRCGTVVSVS